MKTRKGMLTRERIIFTASQLFQQKGVAESNLEEILAQSKTGKGQFYHYFQHKNDLVLEVLRYHLLRFDQCHQLTLQSIEHWSDFKIWLMQFCQDQIRLGLNGCPIGSIASERANLDPELRKEAQIVVQELINRFETVIQRIQQRNSISSQIPAAEISLWLWSQIQGSLLLAKIFYRPEILLEPLHHTLNSIEKYGYSTSISNSSSSSSSVSSIPGNSVLSASPSAARN